MKLQLEYFWHVFSSVSFASADEQIKRGSFGSRCRRLVCLRSLCASAGERGYCEVWRGRAGGGEDVERPFNVTSVSPVTAGETDDQSDL